MSFLAKFFQNKQAFTSTSPNNGKKENTERSSDDLTHSAIRLVVFRDHDVKGRTVVFDSQVHRSDSQGGPRRTGSGKRCDNKDGGTAAPRPATAKPAAAKKPSDSDRLGEMMFGSVTMTYKGATLKVHSMRTPPQLMITKVFTPSNPLSRDAHGASGGLSAATTPSSEPESLSFDNYSFASTGTQEPSTPRDISSGSSGGGRPAMAPILAQSMPMSVPVQSPPHRDPPLALALAQPETHDSGISGSVTSLSSVQATPFPSPGSSASNSASNSLSSIQRSSNNSNSFNRRYYRSLEKSLEHPGLTEKDGSLPQPPPASKRAPQFGIGIVFSLPEHQLSKNKQFELFVFSHIMLLEGHVNRLKLIIERSLASRMHPHARLQEALQSFRQTVIDLYLAPRIQEPVWLSMMTSTSHKVTLCQRFLKEFMVAKEKYDTRSNRFLSTLLTGVLMHHLSWVPTVTPAGSTHSATYLHKHSAKWLDTLAKSHPYNPLWAQLGDMYGTIGFPLRMSRTVISGKKHDVIKRLLYLMTYFIRCSEVFQRTDQSDRMKLDRIEYLSKSKEISIPDSCSSGGKMEGSYLSANSYQTQYSACICAECGKNIDAVTQKSDTNSYSGSFEQSQSRSRLNSRGRLKSPTSPISESKSVISNSDDKHRQAVLKLINMSMDKTTHARISTEGVKTVRASQLCTSPSFNESSRFKYGANDADTTPDKTRTKRPDTLPLEPNSVILDPCSQVEIAEQTVQESDTTICDRDAVTDKTKESVLEPAETSNTIWYVSLDDMYAADEQSEPTYCDSANELETSHTPECSESLNNVYAENATSEISDNAVTSQTSMGAITSQSLNVFHISENKDITEVCDDKNNVPLETNYGTAANESLENKHGRQTLEDIPSVNSGVKPHVNKVCVQVDKKDFKSSTNPAEYDESVQKKLSDSRKKSGDSHSVVASCDDTSRRPQSRVSHDLVHVSHDLVHEQVSRDHTQDTFTSNEAVSGPTQHTNDHELFTNEKNRLCCKYGASEFSSNSVRSNNEHIGLGLECKPSTLDTHHSGNITSVTTGKDKSQTPKMSRVRIGSQIENKNSGRNSIGLQAEVISAAMTTSYRRVLDEENSVEGSSDRELCSGARKGYPSATVGLYPTLDSATIPENTYTKPASEQYPLSDHTQSSQIPLYTGNQLDPSCTRNNTLYPSLACSVNGSSMSRAASPGRKTPTLYPILSEVSAVDEAHMALNTCDIQKGPTSATSIAPSHPGLNSDARPNVFHFPIGGSKDLKTGSASDIKSDVIPTIVTSSVVTGSMKSDFCDHKDAINPTNSTIEYAHGRSSKSTSALLRQKQDQSVTKEDRSVRSKSTPVGDNKAEQAARGKLLSCPDERHKQRLANEPSEKSTRRERICFVGRDAADTGVSDISTADSLKVPDGDLYRDSGYSGGLNSPRCNTLASRGPDSGVFELSLEMSGELLKDPFQTSYEIPSSSRETSVERDFEMSIEEETEKQPENQFTILQAQDSKADQSKKVDYLRLESSDSIFDEQSCLPSLSEISERVQTDLMKCEKGSSESKPLYRRLISEGSVSVFDEYYDETQPVELPNSATLHEQTPEPIMNQSDAHTSAGIDQNETLTSIGTLLDSDSHTHDGEPLERCVEKSEKLHRRLLSSLSAEIDVSSIISDSDIEGSMCSDCINRIERSSSVSVMSQPKRKRVPYRKQTSLPTGTPGRCRSVTPTELGRRRNISTSTLVQELTDSADLPESPTLSMQEVTIPSSPSEEPQQSPLPRECHFGLSLLADVSDHYMADFALHGTSDSGFVQKLHQDLMHAVASPVLDERIAESACVVADTDKWSVKVLSCKYGTSDRVHTQELVTSRLVGDILDSLYNLCKLKMSPEFCVMHLEDRLQEVYFKSRMLSEYIKTNARLDLKELAAVLGFAESDIPLLLSVAGTHTPHLALGLM